MFRYYLRKLVTPDVPAVAILPLFDEIPEPTSYPCMLKGADSQYYIETRLVRNRSEWKSHIRKILKDPKKIEDRKRFYHKYVPDLASRWQDIVIFHVEPYFEGPEHQIELFMDYTSNILCDTGDVIKKDGNRVDYGINPNLFHEALSQDLQLREVLILIQTSRYF